MQRVYEHIKHAIKATEYSLQGLKAAWENEAAFRLECTLGVILGIVALCLPISGIEKIILICTLLLVLIVELLNSAIEKTVDHAGLNYSEFARRAKDMGSAAVFLSMIVVALVWAFVIIKCCLS